MRTKLISKSDLLTKVLDLKQEGKKVVATSGSYDLLNAKHIEILSEFKEQGEVLVIFLNSDESIRAYKGIHRPIISENDRVIQLSAVAYVDYIVLFDDITPLGLVEELKPDVYCNGPDWGEECLEKDTVLSYGGSMYIAKISPRESTSDIITRIQRLKDEPDVKAIFLDRDGIIIKDTGCVHKSEDVKLVPGIVELLTFLQNRGYMLVIITNQSGIGRGMFTDDDFHTTNNYIVEQLRGHGVTITGTFYCPHKPEDGCICRKPGYGLFLEAAKKHGIALARSYMIGDKVSDVQAGKRVNCKTIFVSSDENERAASLATFTAESVESLFTKVSSSILYL